MAGQQAGAMRRGNKRPRLGDLRGLRWLSIALPLTFLIVIELFRFLFVADAPIDRAEHVAIAAIAAIGILGFSMFMFTLIERAEAKVIRQNRELTAINAVSTAVQGELAVEQIIDAALEVVIRRTNATEASVTIFPRDQARNGALERKVVRSSHVPFEEIGEIGPLTPHLVDIPLTHRSSIVGRMRVHLEQGELEPDLLAATTLNNIGHQLACAIEIGQLVGDLKRRRQETDALYDVLLHISSQKPLAETLAAVVHDARELLSVEAVQLSIGPACAVLLDGQSGELVTWRSDGSAWLGDDKSAVVGERNTVRISLVSPEVTIGELWVVRRGVAFSERESGLLHSLGELAVIAVTSSRMREGERQMAILAERERIAREMHDSLAQVLGFLHLQLRALRGKVAGAEPQMLASSLVELADVAEEAYRDVREAILGLRESSHVDRNLFESLQAYLERYEHQSGVKASLETDFEEPPRLSPQAEIQMIRVVQEALTNVRKHSAASRATVRVSCDEGTVTFCVEDDGHGFDLSRAALQHDGGFGLHAMRERMDLIAGTLTIDSAPGRGTRVVAQVPAQPGNVAIGDGMRLVSN